jgi:hypothetical protein
VVIKPFAFFLVLAPALFSFFALAHFPSLAFVFCFCCVLRSSSLKKNAVARIIFRAYMHQDQPPVTKLPPQVGQTTKGGVSTAASKSSARSWFQSSSALKFDRKSKKYYLRFV